MVFLEIAFMMKMDEKDRLIVRLLREDARMPVSELSKRVGLSGPSTGDRMRRLEANGIISRFTVDLDLEALGYPLQAIVRIKPRPGNMHVGQDGVAHLGGRNLLAAVRHDVAGAQALVEHGWRSQPRPIGFSSPC
jgi:DNA-binding Lrp family transcriptional regulator